jgi:GNAT superfamily N-acetyltransferase
MAAQNLIYAPAAPADAQPLSLLYARAFSHSPAYAAIFAHPRGSPEQARALAWLFERRVRALLSLGNVFLVAREPAAAAAAGAKEAGSSSSGSRVVAAVGLVAPSRRPSLLTVLRHGMAAWPCAHGLPSMLRALKLDARLNESAVLPSVAAAAAAKSSPSARHEAEPWEVVMMAVDPSLQGKGVGSALLARLLALADGGGAGGDGDDGCGAEASAPLKHGVPMTLSTQEARNVPFYEKAGFVVERTEVVRLGGGVEPFETWAMRRMVGRGGKA